MCMGRGGDDIVQIREFMKCHKYSHNLNTNNTFSLESSHSHLQFTPMISGFL